MKLPRHYLVVCASVLLLCLAACQPQPQSLGFAGLAQGSSYHVSYHGGDQVAASDLQQAVEAELQRIDKLMSNYRSDSVIEQFNQLPAGASMSVGAELVALFRQALQVSAASDGCFDLTLQPLGRLWGFADDQLQIPDTATLTALLQRIGMAQIEVVDSERLRKHSATAALDLSSIAQGYTAARMAWILEQHGIVDYIAEIGGEMVLRGRREDGSPWQVAIQHPGFAQQPTAWRHSVSAASDSAVALTTSGSYRHYLSADGRRYSHVLDARNGYPVQHNTVSVTVQHSDAALADAWSTALLCLGLAQGVAVANEQGIAALFIQTVNAGDAAAAANPVDYEEVTSAFWRDRL